MKKTEVLNTMTEAIGLEKATALLNTYLNYIESEFEDDGEDLAEEVALGEMPIAYTTSENENYELNCSYDWISEKLIYTADSDENHRESSEDYSIETAIEFGFDFDDAIYHCESLIEED